MHHRPLWTLDLFVQFVFLHEQDPNTKTGWSGLLQVLLLFLSFLRVRVYACPRLPAYNNLYRCFFALYNYFNNNKLFLAPHKYVNNTEHMNNCVVLPRYVYPMLFALNKTGGKGYVTLYIHKHRQYAAQVGHIKCRLRLSILSPTYIWPLSYLDFLFLYIFALVSSTYIWRLKSKIQTHERFKRTLFIRTKTIYKFSG